MAKLCVRIRPNDHPTDPSLNAGRTGVGDVISVVPDSHVFSRAELANGQYRILELPGVLPEEVIYLIESNETHKRVRGLGTAALQLDRTVTKAQLALLARTRT